MKHTQSFPKAIILLSSLLLTAGVSQADMTAEERGLEIAIEADRRDTGFNDNTAGVMMVLRNRHGESSERQMKIRTLEVENDGDKSLVTFDHPRDVKGTAFLSYTHKEGADDQWLYLPALKRVKRIASNNKSGPFVGSEFAYEDISSQEVEKYTYKYIKDDMLDGKSVYVVERYPVDPKSGYTKQITWIDQDEYRVWKVEFYDRKGDLLKTLNYEGYNQYLDQYWRADKFFMQNHQTGKSTELVWSDYNFGTGLSDRDFDQRSLQRAR